MVGSRIREGWIGTYSGETRWVDHRPTAESAGFKAAVHDLSGNGFGDEQKGGSGKAKGRAKENGVFHFANERCNFRARDFDKVEDGEPGASETHAKQIRPRQKCEERHLSWRFSALDSLPGLC